MAAQLHYVVANIEYSRWSSHIQEWKNKIANDIEYQKQKQEDLLVEGVNAYIMLFVKNKLEHVNLHEEGDYYDAKYENGLSEVEPYFECYVDENEQEGVYEVLKMKNIVSMLIYHLIL